MKKLRDFRVVLGGGLFVLGALMLMEQLGWLKGASSLFWGVVLAAFGASFLYTFSQNMRGSWWALIPGLALIGLGLESLLPASLQIWSGAVFLGMLGLSFWLVYFTDRSRWWGIIPGGVLFTLAVTSRLEDSPLNTGAIFFIGLGLTFLLVAILPNGGGRMNWAYIPAAVLLIMGAFIGNESTVGLANYVWPVALILIGAFIVAGFFFRRD